MTVAELIEKLKQMPQDLRVARAFGFPEEAYDGLSFVHGKDWVEKEDDTRVLLINIEDVITVYGMWFDPREDEREKVLLI